jgi:PEGA domain
MPRCSWCNQSRWVYLRFRRQADLIELLTGCVPFRCIACSRRGWHRARRVPPVLVILWRAAARLSPRPVWARCKVAAQTVRQGFRVAVTPIARILTMGRLKVQTLAAASSRQFAAARRTRVNGAPLVRPLLAIPGVMAAAFVLGFWLGPARFSNAAPEASGVITSAGIDTPEPVDATAGISAVGMPVPAPAPLRVELPASPRIVDGTRGQVSRADVARVVRAASRSSRAAKPKPARATETAPTAARAATAARATATAPSNEPKFHGTLSIRSEPLGALVWVDGELVGATPVTLRKVAAGSVVVRIESGGYERWSSAARVVANQETAILASLQRGSEQ